MAGILNKKERFVDYQLTDIGKQKLSDPVDNERKFFYAAVSDKMSIYEKDNFTNVPVFEVVADLGTISPINNNAVVGMHSWNDEMLYNCTANNGFNYYDGNEAGTTTNCVTSSFIISSFYRRLKNHSNILTEAEREENSKFLILSDNNVFITDDNSIQYNLGETVDFNNNFADENMASHPDIQANMVNLKRMTPVGFSKSDNYSVISSGNSKNISTKNRKGINFKFDKTSAKSNCVLQIYGVKQKSFIDNEQNNIDFFRLEFVKVSPTTYVVGKFINKEKIKDTDKDISSAIDILRTGYFNVAASSQYHGKLENNKGFNPRANYPLLDNNNKFSSTWTGNSIVFVKLFTLELIK